MAQVVSTSAKDITIGSIRSQAEAVRDKVQRVQCFLQNPIGICDAEGSPQAAPPPLVEIAEILAAAFDAAVAVEIVLGC